MTAPTSEVQKLKKALANGEPSTHDPRGLVWYLAVSSAAIRTRHLPCHVHGPGPMPFPGLAFLNEMT